MARPRSNRLLPATFMALATVALTAGPVHAAPPTPVPPGSTYVALGSSYAAGGSIGPADPGDVGGWCGRTLTAYPNLVSAALNLDLTNATCGGAKIENLAQTPQALQSWDGTQHTTGLQIDAVGSDTALVTITIGGNDVWYVGNLMAEACLGDLAANPESEVSSVLQQYGVCTPRPDSAVLAELRGIQSELVTAIEAVHQKAPNARIVLVDYVTVLPQSGQACAVAPISKERQKFALRVARELSLATKHAAHQTGAEFVAASTISRNHDACSSEPWVTGYDPSLGWEGVFTGMHPTAAGQAAVAQAVVDHLSTRPSTTATQ